MKKIILAVNCFLLLLCLVPHSVNALQKNSAIAAKKLFGTKTTASSQNPEPFGAYAKGCLTGAKQLATDGDNWQTMRLSRNRNWGHPDLLTYVERLANDANSLDGWSGLLVGDMSQPRGGPMLTGHKSHQIGLDADIWLLAAPDKNLNYSQRENLSALSVIKSRFKINPKAWTENHARLLRRAASYPEVARIFVHPSIKKTLCNWADDDRSWLRKIRAWYGHHYHFHVRLKCPDNSDQCVNQAPPPAGDGCGKELNWWLSNAAYKPTLGEKPKPRKIIKLNDLPVACSTVLYAPDKVLIENQ